MASMKEFESRKAEKLTNFLSIPEKLKEKGGEGFWISD